jgi:hypothetical protein
VVQKLNNICSQADTQDYRTNNSRILGLCTGALAAAAVSCSRTTLELIPIAVDAVIVAFRLGMLVTDVAQRVEPSEASDPSWSTIVAGLASAEAVHRFCEQSVRILASFPPKYFRYYFLI